VRNEEYTLIGLHSADIRYLCTQPCRGLEECGDRNVALNMLAVRASGQELPFGRQASELPHSLSEKPSAKADGVFTNYVYCLTRTVLIFRENDRS
jgi:hypothetical protein